MGKAGLVAIILGATGLGALAYVLYKKSETEPFEYGKMTYQKDPETGQIFPAESGLLYQHEIVDVFTAELDPAAEDYVKSLAVARRLDFYLTYVEAARGMGQSEDWIQDKLTAFLGNYRDSEGKALTETQIKQDVAFLLETAQ